MSNSNPNFKASYGLNQPIVFGAPSPIVAKRDPKTSDIGYQIGQLWVEPLTNSLWILTSIVSNSANWESLGGSGAGVFGSLTVNPGPVALVTVGSGQINIGNSANTSPIFIDAGTGITGNVFINGNGSSILIGTDLNSNTIRIGGGTGTTNIDISGGSGTGLVNAAIFLSTAAAGDIFIGATTHTGIISIGNSTAASGETVDIANSAFGGNTTVNLLNGIGTAGTGSFDVLSNSGQTGAGVVNIGRGGSIGGGANTIVIGSNSAASALTLASGTGNTVINTAVTGTITIGSAAQTGSIILGESTAGQTISIVDSAGANPVNIATQAASATGAVTIGNSTGNVNTGGTLTSAAGITATTGNITSTAGDLVASTAAKGVVLGGGAKVVCGTGDPNTVVTAPKGSLYLNLGGSGVGDRAYINTDSATAWTAITTAS